MRQDDIRDHIRRSAGQPSAASRGISVRIMRAYWPGGPADRLDVAALSWADQWRPIRWVIVPGCACRTGRCPICN